MPAERIQIADAESSSPELRRVAKALADGAIVVFPTETVYGVCANASIGSSIRRLQAIKTRDADKPFTVHVGRKDQVDAYVPEMRPMARRLVRKGWPGPMTLIFDVEQPSTASIHPRLSDEGAASIFATGSVGVRCPANAVACELINLAEAPIVASSANAGGDPAPTIVDTMKPEFLDAVDYVVDTGETLYRKASTIVRLNGSGFRVVREGVLDERTVQRFARIGILFVCTGNTCRSPIAEGICKKLLAERMGCRPDELAARGVVVRSAGTSAWGAGPAAAQSVEVCASRQIDLSMHQSQRLTDDLIRNSDYIFALTSGHLNMIREMSHGSPAIVELLDEQGDIADPVGGPVSQYEQVANQIEHALAKRLEEVEI